MTGLGGTAAFDVSHLGIHSRIHPNTAALKATYGF